MVLRLHSVLLLLLATMSLSWAGVNDEIDKIWKRCESPRPPRTTLFCFMKNPDPFVNGYVEYDASGNPGRNGIILDVSDDSKWVVHVMTHDYTLEVFQYYILIKTYTRTIEMVCDQGRHGTQEFTVDEYGHHTPIIEVIVDKDGHYTPIKGIGRLTVEAHTETSATNRYHKLTIWKDGTNEFVPDVLELFAYPKAKLGLHVKYRGGSQHPEPMYSPYFEPFKCAPTGSARIPNTAKKADLVGSNYTCLSQSMDKNIYIGKTLVDSKAVYCAADGWRDADKSLIEGMKHARGPKKLIEDKIDPPYCWTATFVFFENCKIHTCYKFGGDRMTRVDNAADLGPQKIGVYVRYDNNDLWTLGLAYDTRTLREPAFTIGDDAFEFGSTCLGQSLVKGKVVANCFEDVEIQGVAYRSFQLSASSVSVDKDLMSAFGFYSGKANTIKLKFKTSDKFIKGEGLGPKYSRIGHHSFSPAIGGTSVQKPKDPDGDDKFTCSGDDYIYINDDYMKEKEIRYTTMGWMDKSGKKLAPIKKVQWIFCYNICKEHVITLKGISPYAPVKAPTLIYTCKESSVKVSKSYYNNVTCDNGEWKGDGKPIPLLPPTYKFDAECFGAYKFNKDCTTEDRNKGFDKPKIAGDTLSCAPNFFLTLEGPTPDKTTPLYNSLKLKLGKWMIGDKHIGDLKDSDQPRCYSRCAPGNVVTEAVGADTNIVVYTWNDRALKCAEKTDALMATLEGSEKRYLGEVKCNPATGWTVAGLPVKNLNTALKTDDLRVKAHCYKACDGSKVAEAACPAGMKKNDDCETTYAYLKVDKSLSCPGGTVLYVNDKPYDKKLVCSSAGWTKEGESDIVIDYRTKLAVMCFTKCGKQFRSGNAIFDGNTLKCSGNNMISYKVADNAGNTLGELRCDGSDWKNGLIKLVPGAPEKLVADCVPSCTADFIEEQCSGRNFCKKPNFADEKLTCAKGQVLWADNKVETGVIQCSKEKFENTAKTIDIPRSSANVKTKMSCISTCDKQFVVTDSSATDTTGKANTLSREYVDNKYHVECKDPLHYTTLDWGETKPAYSEKKLVCDPVNGWSVADHENGAFFAKLEGKDVKAGCTDVCANRVNDDVCRDFVANTGPCKKPLQTGKKLTCDATHVLRFETKDYIRTELQCESTGFHLFNVQSARKDNKPLLPFTIDGKIQPTRQFDVSCISNCFEEFVSGDAKKTTENRQISTLHCGPNDILLIEIGEVKKRVFGTLTCNAAVGWTGPMVKPGAQPLAIDDNALVIDFKEQVKFKASCVKVCDEAKVAEGCTDEVKLGGDCQKGNYNADDNKLTCDPNYRLFLRGKSTSEPQTGMAKNEMTCSKQGWEADGVTLVDFKDEQEDIMKPIEPLCKHKCHTDFITDSCAEGSTVACSKVTYPSANSSERWLNMSCTNPSEIIVIEHGGKLKESFGDAKCTDDGWKDDVGTEMFKLDEFKYNINARCEQLCDPASLTGTEITSRFYEKLGDTLTCQDNDKMLKFNGKDVYSDMKCSKKGWTTETGIEKLFVANNREESDRKPKAECVKNLCLRDVTDKCEFCTLPDSSIKYKLTCPKPEQKLMAISKSITYDHLQCFGGEWKGISGTALNITENLEIICFAQACTKCEDTLTRLKEDDCSEPSNCDATISFKKGVSSYCSGYSCDSEAFYKIKEGNNKYKYYKAQEEEAGIKKRPFIKCSKKEESDNNEFYAPDGSSTVASAIGCVKKIPCIEHSPLNLDDCTPQTACDKNKLTESLTKASKFNGGGIVKCEAPERIWILTKNEERWKPYDQLFCKKEQAGQWGTVSGTQSTLLDRTQTPRVVCSSNDPTVRAPTTTEAPPDPITKTCKYCTTLPEALNCDGCKKVEDATKTDNSGNGKCIMTAKTGRFFINDGSEASGDLICQKGDNGEYEWRDAQGRLVKKVGVKETLSDKMSIWLIVGIVFFVLLILGGVVGFLVHIKIKRKREAARLEALKSKGLEQKVDSIIDNVSLADTKTLKISAERLDDGPCNHLKPKPVGYKSKYDFALVCTKSRVAQLTALTVQMYVIHSEWDRIGNFHFVLLFVALATHGINTFMRWRGSTDGRFDIKQIYLCNSNNLRVQYALAVLSGPLLALFTYWCLIPQKISLVHATIYSIAAFIKALFAVGCFCLELSEVTRDSIKPYLNYVKSFPTFNLLYI